jgi:hypothetical protein
MRAIAQGRRSTQVPSGVATLEIGRQAKENLRGNSNILFTQLTR